MVPEASIVAPLKYAVGVLGVIAIPTFPLIQLREISTRLIQVMLEIRCAIARGSTRASFSPWDMLAIFTIALRVSCVGAPVTVTAETENIEDQAKR